MTEQAVTCLNLCQSQVLSCALTPSAPWAQTWGKVWSQSVRSGNVLGKESLNWHSKRIVIWRPSKSTWLSYSCLCYVGFGFCLASSASGNEVGISVWNNADTVSWWENNFIQTEGWVIFGRSLVFGWCNCWCGFISLFAFLLATRVLWIACRYCYNPVKQDIFLLCPDFDSCLLFLF